MKNKFYRAASTNIPTKWGEFNLRAYENKKNEYHVALVYGDVDKHKSIPVRIHSSCFTGEVIHSLKCDCEQQLEFAFEYIKNNGFGIIIYLFQEGRGIGLVNKIKAYNLQNMMNIDTIEANKALGLPIDARKYDMVKDILSDIGVKRINLITNNPIKISYLEKLGIEVINNIPVEIKPNKHNYNYLYTKKVLMNHKLFKFL